ncbi:Protein kinase dsk1 [Colletotrichum sp. SAR 10_70]|nr:Protein kinase dsk1 [Colletotrichum sp. SAR 10_71]KAI8150596.1 Protein kinase dsk1 [Colletotrichum sp. SAR 10_70]KAI8215955.1 Protein kinase dsk1 [Colletotrichum sp. SAR 10_86]KAI8248576.1 Protein kinase dsk1 [Colletotrichum sp. SAR11_239]
MNGTQQASEPLAQQPLQPAAANVNANASANANGNSTVAKKRKKEGLKPIITTETPHPNRHKEQRHQ